VRELNLPTAVHCMKGCDVVLQLSKAEIAFLDWLRTNGGEARLSSSVPDIAARLRRANYVTTAPADASRYTLTDEGRLALDLEGF
jgi:hypothetical protein